MYSTLGGGGCDTKWFGSCLKLQDAVTVHCEGTFTDIVYTYRTYSPFVDLRKNRIFVALSPPIVFVLSLHFVTVFSVCSI